MHSKFISTSDDGHMRAFCCGNAVTGGFRKDLPMDCRQIFDELDWQFIFDKLDFTNWISTNWIVNLYMTSWISKQWIFNRYLPQGLVMWWCTSPQEEVNNCDLQNLCDIFRQCAFEYCCCLVIFFTTIYFGTFRFVSFTLCYGTYRWDFNNQYAFDTKTPIGGDDVLVSLQTCIFQ